MVSVVEKIMPLIERHNFFLELAFSFLKQVIKDKVDPNEVNFIPPNFNKSYSGTQLKITRLANNLGNMIRKNFKTYQ
jgi:hypothetical protein